MTDSNVVSLHGLNADAALNEVGAIGVNKHSHKSTPHSDNRSAKLAQIILLSPIQKPFVWQALHIKNLKFQSLNDFYRTNNPHRLILEPSIKSAIQWRAFSPPISASTGLAYYSSTVRSSKQAPKSLNSKRILSNVIFKFNIVDLQQLSSKLRYLSLSISAF